MECFTEHTKLSLGHESRNIDALHKSIVSLQNELTEKNKIIESRLETQTAVLDEITDLRQHPNTPEQNTAEHLSQEKFNQRSHTYRTKIIQEKSDAKEWKRKECMWVIFMRTRQKAI